MNFLHVFTLFVIDIHQIMLISLFPTPFGHFQFLGSAGQNPKLILKLCHMPNVHRSRRFFYFPTIVEGAWRMSCTVCTQSGVIEDLMRAEGQRGRELDEKSLNPVNQLLRGGASRLHFWEKRHRGGGNDLTGEIRLLLRHQIPPPP